MAQEHVIKINEQAVINASGNFNPAIVVTFICHPFSLVGFVQVDKIGWWIQARSCHCAAGKISITEQAPAVLTGVAVTVLTTT